jgi:hypothetical protein
MIFNLHRAKSRPLFATLAVRSSGEAQKDNLCLQLRAENSETLRNGRQLKYRSISVDAKSWDSLQHVKRVSTQAAKYRLLCERCGLSSSRHCAQGGQ